ncbi:MAG: CpaF family protein [Holosporaceae bacterium]|jgi:pilus assembly protein CpaF|nr:CpaF family protein [Holosporaceae bacterium]
MTSDNRNLQNQDQAAAEESPLLTLFRKEAYESMLNRINLASAFKLSPQELRLEIENFVFDFAQERRAQLTKREQIGVARELVDDMIGLGPLEVLLDDDLISDIVVNGPYQIYVERRGIMQLAPIRFRDDSHLLQIAQRIAHRVGRRVDTSSPLCDARLPDGSRVNIVVPPIALDGTSISIRKFSKKAIDLPGLAKHGSLTEEMVRLLQIASTCGLNIIVSGGTGSGKTTLLNALSQLIDPRERIVTCEDAAELKLQQPHVVRLESRPPNIEGKGEITIRDLVKNALRMRPDRIVIGEVRGSECIDMLQAMNTGHDGSMSTIHANRAKEAFIRLENMVAMSGFDLPSEIVRAQIAGAVNLVVQTERMHDGSRKITEIVEVIGVNERGDIEYQHLFKFVPLGETEDHKVFGKFDACAETPAFLEKAIVFGLDKELLSVMKAAKEKNGDENDDDFRKHFN